MSSTTWGGSTLRHCGLHRLSVDGLVQVLVPFTVFEFTFVCQHVLPKLLFGAKFPEPLSLVSAVFDNTRSLPFGCGRGIGVATPSHTASVWVVFLYR